MSSAATFKFDAEIMAAGEKKCEYHNIHSLHTYIHKQEYLPSVPPRLPPGRGGTKPGGSEARVRDREGLQVLVGRSSCGLINYQRTRWR